MSKDYASLPLTEVRRSDRAVTDEGWIKAFLGRAPVCTLATVHDGQPFINTNLFVYDEAAHAIYMHTARVGRTQANVSADERVCFSIHDMGRLLPADEALEFSVEYSGVVVFGRASIMTDTAAAKRALQMLLDKYFPHLKPGEHYRATTDAELARTAVYRITIDSWSGKQKKVGDDFPGAFLYGQQPE
ncbi:MAG: pyridoxamine 5'-phosphate oxidase family protein [Anaerolineaceae bacterium]|nr:pyridoxamine 5'-phosphate oxidase family protein [Anaerolineaceae bacterium]